MASLCTACFSSMADGTRRDRQDRNAGGSTHPPEPEQVDLNRNTKSGSTAPESDSGRLAQDQTCSAQAQGESSRPEKKVGRILVVDQVGRPTVKLTAAVEVQAFPPSRRRFLAAGIVPMIVAIETKRRWKTTPGSLIAPPMVGGTLVAADPPDRPWWGRVEPFPPPFGMLSTRERQGTARDRGIRPTKPLPIGGAEAVICSNSASYAGQMGTKKSALPPESVIDRADEASAVALPRAPPIKSNSFRAWNSERVAHCMVEDGPR